MDEKLFKNPPAQYRPVPFWSWNDKLEDEELIRQAREMNEKGWGGFFMHSRKGLETPYLSEEWMERIKTCIDEAEKLGLGAWLYDEDKWPSGFCGGSIPRLGKEYRQKALLMREDEAELPEEDIKLLSVYAVHKVRKNIYEDITHISEEDIEKYRKDGFNILYFYIWTQPIGPNRFNNSAWVDLLNPKVTKAFLESTHEKYKQYVGDSFGNTVPGIFTDESTILYWAYAPKLSLPWSEYFEDYFKEFKGYSIADKVIFLFIDLQGYEKIRFDFWDTVTYYFTHNYVELIHQWCKENKLKYTGHFMAEDYFEFTMQYIGSLMPLYEYMDIPGVDHLNRNINDIMTVKQVTSAAHQLNKERALCEMFGCSGQNFSFQDQKWILDWNLIHGINLINPHLSLYSMRGERKRDYPPNLFYQQPWWKHNNMVADYSGRLTYLLTQGERITDVLVLHSIQSAWCTYNPTHMVLEEEGQFDTPDSWIEYKPSREFRVNELSYNFDWLLNKLLQLHYDYDLGDETIIEGHGRVKEGLFHVGSKGYSIVLVPDCITLRQNTVRLLLEFVEAGGKVIFTNNYPYLMDGRRENNEFLKALISKTVCLYNNENALKQALESNMESRLKILGHGNEHIWYHMRAAGNKRIIFLANTNNKESIKVDIHVKLEGEVSEWNPLTGNINNINCEKIGGVVKITNTFEACGSLALVIDSSKPFVEYKEKESDVIKEDIFSEKWSVEPQGVNSLTLDFCSLTVDGELMPKKAPTHRAADMLVNPCKNIELAYEFENVSWNGEKALIAVESPEKFDIFINNEPINDRFTGEYWVDKSIMTAPINDLVKQGKNYINLRTKWKEYIEVEAVYVLGNFEVENRGNKEFCLLNNRNKTVSGNLVYNGYPFYQGEMVFKQIYDLEEKESCSYILEINQQGSIIVSVEVNGKSAGSAAWLPYRFDITDLLEEGANEIAVRLTTSLHNLLGPHHSRKGEIIACAPASFRDENNWTDSYTFVELGIRKASIYKIV